MAIAGASRYLNSAVLANSRGEAPSLPSVLGTGPDATGLLDVGRKDTGVGLSGNGRALNNQLISQTAAGFNQIFSLNGVEFGTTETLQQKILAIRATLPESSLSSELRGDELDTIA